jgi:hypothetical protein
MKKSRLIILMLLSGGATWVISAQAIKTMDAAHTAVSALAQLQPELDHRLSETITGIQNRARQQLDWLPSQELAISAEESATLRGHLQQLLSIRFESNDDFEQADRLQNEVSNVLARKLVAGALSRDFAKKIERLDMVTQRQRAEYFEVVRRQRALLKTPLVGRVTGEKTRTFKVALTFPSERALLEAGR